METYININQISYSYEGQRALNNINIEVNKNELFGLIGPDGAGKTTLMRLITTLLLPQEGQITCDSMDVVKDYKKLRTQIGYMPGKFSLYEDLTVSENLDFFASVFKTSVKENYYLIEDVYKMLEPFKNRKAGKLSGGMKQKLALSCALVHKPKFLVLDEPTTGVDAVSRREFWDLLSKLKQMGITLIVSTPYMDEASRCERVALIKDGHILQTDSPQGIVSSFNNNLFAVKHKDNYDLLQSLKNVKEINNVYIYGQELHVEINKDFEIGFLKAQINKMGFDSVLFDQINPTIEDCFIQKMLMLEN